MNTITYGHKVAGVGIEPIPPYMVEMKFDSSILEQFEQAKRKGHETLGKKDEQSDKGEVPSAVVSVAAAAGVATAGVRSAHSMDVER